MELFFGIFSLGIVLGAFGVIFSSNLIYSVIALIFTFFNATGLFIMLNTEFIAFTMMIVYVGAVMVMFLFVIMMLQTIYKNRALAKFAFGFGSITLAEALIILYKTDFKAAKIPALYAQEFAGSAQNIAKLLYSNHAMMLQVVGLILMVAMVGAIVLTKPKNNKNKAKSQNVGEQNHRSSEITWVDTPLNTGISTSKERKQ